MDDKQFEAKERELIIKSMESDQKNNAKEMELNIKVREKELAMMEADAKNNQLHVDQQLKLDKIEAARRNIEVLCKLVDMNSMQDKYDKDKVKNVVAKCLEVLGTIKE